MAELCKLDGNTQFKQRNWEASAVSPTSFGHQARTADLAVALCRCGYLSPLQGCHRRPERAVRSPLLLRPPASVWQRIVLLLQSLHGQVPARQPTAGLN